LNPLKVSNLLDITYQIEDINTVTQQILQRLTSKTILFYGDMGVGKTTLIKSLAKLLGCDDEVSSPTFSIVNEYVTKDSSIFHFDFYRIKDEDEALNFGFEDYLYTPNWVFIEWPENVKNLLPEDVNIIEVSHVNETSRHLKLNKTLTITLNDAMNQCKI